MEISQHIKDLLFTHDRVILSGFGAFIAKYSPAKIDKKTNTMSPPGKEIIFDPKVTKDGGLLESHIAKYDKVSQADAEKQILEYVKTVKSKLNSGKKVKFPELGTFTKIKDDQIIFLYQPTGNLLLNSYGLPKISLPENIKEKKIKSEVKKPKHVQKTGRFRKVIIIAASIILAVALALFLIYKFKPDYWAKGQTYITQLLKFDKQKSDTIANNTGDIDNLPDVDTTVKHDTTNSDDGNKTDTNNNQIKPDDSNDNNKKPISSDTNDETYSGQYKMPKKRHFYLVVASLESANEAEKEKARLRRRGVKVDIIPAKNSQYRLSLGEFKSSLAASNFFDKFHDKHESIETWLWENK